MIIYFLIIFLNFSNFLLSFIYFFFHNKKNCFVNFVIIFKIISFKTALEISTL